jgi:hypothetical protein
VFGGVASTLHHMEVFHGYIPCVLESYGDIADALAATDFFIAVHTKPSV